MAVLLMGHPYVSGMAGESIIMKVVVAGLAESLVNFRGPLLAKMVKDGHDLRGLYGNSHRYEQTD